MDDLIEMLRRLAEWPDEADPGTIGAIAGEAADALEEARAEREVIGAEAVKYAERSGRLEARADRLAAALHTLAAHVRPTCSVLWGEAQAALHNYEQEVGNE